MTKASQAVRDARNSIIQARRDINDPDPLPTKIDNTLSKIETVLTEMVGVLEAYEKVRDDG